MRDTEASRRLRPVELVGCYSVSARNVSRRARPVRLTLPVTRSNPLPRLSLFQAGAHLRFALAAVLAALLWGAVLWVLA